MLEKLYEEFREEHKISTKKSDENDIVLEIEQIENEWKLRKELASADNLMYKLTRRHEESNFLFFLDSVCSHILFWQLSV